MKIVYKHQAVLDIRQTQEYIAEKMCIRDRRQDHMLAQKYGLISQ